ncbi:thymidylate synthase, partial [Methanothrix soehngenii]|uniref:thymidylate synthase n=1 Tax=Methanothrix soehngenii TaxID=2223 RepID=UPI002BACAC67
FEYTYGERLRAWESHEIPDSYNVKTDQVEYIIRKLKANRTTRRAVGCTWNPLTDEKPGFHPPCLMVADFKIRGEALNLIAYFRSHDIEQAWPQNVYGLYKLQEYIAGEVYAELGTLTTISASAHIYINPGEEA